MGFCEDKKQFNVHKVVLSACSQVFKSIISDTNTANQVIYFRGIHSYEMESILRFFYHGQTTFYQNRIEEFLNVAKILEIKEICRDSMEVEIRNQDDIQAENETSETCVSRVIESYVEEDGLKEDKDNSILKPTEDNEYATIKAKEG